MNKIVLTGILGWLFLFSYCPLNAQDDDLEALLEEEMGTIKENILGTFLSAYVLNNPSVEMLSRNGANFRISHKFDFLNTGANNFYGFDHSSVYCGLEYAPLDWLNLGIGRNTFRESINSQLRVRIIRQSKGNINIPITLVAYGELDYSTKEYTNEDLNSDKTGRIEYTSQLLLASKINSSLSIQIMPTYIHRNLVKTKEDINSIYALGLGGTYRLYKRFRINAEYFWVQNHNTTDEKYYSPLSIGICYQTSRHAFELFATNSSGITSNNHIAFTKGDFWAGDICIGFNVSIVFSVKR